ncbi:MAG TPA: TonB family protein [Steroidobacteraceae bacterium]|nr:TonB family protein [Steroidobacteraceae bacterium]
MAYYGSRHDSSFYSQRTVFFIAIVLLHIGLYFMFKAGLATRVIKMIEPPVQVDVVQETKKLDTPPPPPPPKMEHPPVEIPPPEVTINMPAEAQTTAITNVTTRHVAPPPPPPPRQIIRTAASILRAPPTTDYYPPTSQRLGETGTTIIRLCSAPDGSVEGKPTVARSSGSPRLDEAAVRWGSHVRMRPATEDGKPVQGCVNMGVKFVLQD